MKTGDVDLRVVEGKTEFIGHMPDFKKHKYHRHNQQNDAGHGAGQPGHQGGRERHQLVGVYALQHTLRGHMNMQKGQRLLQPQDFCRQLFIIFWHHGDKFVNRRGQYAN